MHRSKTMKFAVQSDVFVSSALSNAPVAMLFSGNMLLLDYIRIVAYAAFCVLLLAHIA